MKDRGSERIEFLGSDSSSPESNLIDLSSTGVALVYSKMKKTGESMSVLIKDLTFDASVIYCTDRSDGFRLGLHFRNVLPESRQKLAKLVEEFSRGVPLSCSVIDSDKEQKKV